MADPTWTSQTKMRAPQVRVPSGSVDSAPVRCPSSPPTPSCTPFDRIFHQLQYRNNAGHWRLFAARRISDNKEATLFLFDRKDNVKVQSRIGRSNRLALTDLIKYDVTQLAALTHPRVLLLMHGLEESKEMMAFASERLHASLDTVVIEEGIHPLEIKLGVLQLTDALSYLHNSAHILHGNITPGAVFVTSTRLWKLGGFAFSVGAKEANGYPGYPWTKKLPPALQPDLDFLAPEYLQPNVNRVTAAADVFSLGLLICWIYAGGKRLIDAKNNVETHAVVCGQLDEALNQISEELGANLLEALCKVLSVNVDARPTPQFLALIKHFSEPGVSCLRQLDDISQEFDPSLKAQFLSQTLCACLPAIPQHLWFARILARFNEQLQDCHELYGAMARPLMYMLDNCECQNIHKLRPWIRRIVDQAAEPSLAAFILESMSILFRRLSDESVEERLLERLLQSLCCSKPLLQSAALLSIPSVAEFLPVNFVTNRLLVAFEHLGAYLSDNVTRQVELLTALGAVSDRCESATLSSLLRCMALCTGDQPVVLYAKCALIQRVLAHDAHRVRDVAFVCEHLLSPVIAGLPNPKLSHPQFDDVISTARMLLDVVEQRRYDRDENNGGHVPSNAKLRRPSMSLSSSHLPRVLITAAKPSFGDTRKMSFLSADGRLEDGNGRRGSRDSRGSIESVSVGKDYSTGPTSSVETLEGCSIGNRKQQQNGHAQRRKSWLGGYMHSCSLEQSSGQNGGSLERAHSVRRHERHSDRSGTRSRTRSPTNELAIGRQPGRPNSITNLGLYIVENIQLNRVSQSEQR